MAKTFATFSLFQRWQWFAPLLAVVVLSAAPAHAQSSDETPSRRSLRDGSTALLVEADAIVRPALAIPLFYPFAAGSSLATLSGYPSTPSFMGPYTPTSLSCSINTACSEGEGWENESRSVVKISNGCTGVLVNNTRGDQTPYVLTAYHCGQPSVGQTLDWVFTFNYQSASCADPAETPPVQSVSGAIVRAAEGDGPDFLLLELLEPIPAEYTVYYAGWTIEEHTPASGVVIGHPNGDLKKITVDDDPIGTVALYWDTRFDHGSIEVGSSGSPLFNQNHQLIGVVRSNLGINLEACTGPDGDDNEARILFPKLSFNWNRGEPGERISDFLDPDGTGAVDVSSLPGSGSGEATAVWINEINADTQTGPEDDEFIELVGPPGTDLDGYQLDIYSCGSGTSTLTSSHTLNAFVLPSDFSNFGLFVIAGPALDARSSDQTFSGSGTDILPDGSGIVVLKNPSGDELFDYQYDTGSTCPSGRTTRSAGDALGAATMGFTSNTPPSGSEPGTASLTASPGTQNFDGGQALPVELTSFEALLDGPTALLTWTTYSETNNAGFELQVREGGRAKREEDVWDVLGWIDGHGTTEMPQSYAYRVDGLEPGHHVFRLKQVDYDGTFEYSPEVEVVVEMVERFVIEPAYPNPFNPEAQFRFAVNRPQAVRIALYDVLGRQVRVLYAGDTSAGQMHTVRLDGRGLPSGTYLVRIVGERFVETQTVTLLK